MTLYLVQHGRSLPRDIDPEQGLSEEGVADTERIAAVAKGYDVAVARIGHSGKKRARQTADIFASALRPAGGIGETAGLKPLDDAAAMEEKICSENGVMLVGHLPFMERLTSHLITGAAEKPVFKFQNSGIVCLERDDATGFWAITWTLMPAIGQGNFPGRGE
jgi:phosphohistidine phosphatase